VQTAEQVLESLLGQAKTVYRLMIIMDCARLIALAQQFQECFPLLGIGRYGAI
jgi:hypothetical protein